MWMYGFEDNLCCSGFAIMAVRKITKGLVETSHRGVSLSTVLRQW